MLLLSVNNIVRQFDAAPVLDGVTFEICVRARRSAWSGPTGRARRRSCGSWRDWTKPTRGNACCTPRPRWRLLEQAARFSDERTLLDEAKIGLAPLYALQREAEAAAHAIAAEADAAGSREAAAPLRRAAARSASALGLQHRSSRRRGAAGAGIHPRPVRSADHAVQRRPAEPRAPGAAAAGGPRSDAARRADEPSRHRRHRMARRVSRALRAGDSGRQPRPLFSRQGDEPHAGTVQRHDRRLSRAIFRPTGSSKRSRPKCRNATWEKQQAFIEKTEDFIRRNHYSNSIQAHDREKKLARLERVDRPRTIVAPPMGFGKPKRTGDWVIEAVGLTKGFDRPLFTDVSLQVLRGDRVGFSDRTAAARRRCCELCWENSTPDAGTVRLGHERRNRLLRPAACRRRSRAGCRRCRAAGQQPDDAAGGRPRTRRPVRAEGRHRLSEGRQPERRREEQGGPGQSRGPECQRADSRRADEPSRLVVAGRAGRGAVANSTGRCSSSATTGISWTGWPRRSSRSRRLAGGCTREIIRTTSMGRTGGPAKRHVRLESGRGSQREESSKRARQSQQPRRIRRKRKVPVIAKWMT